MKKIKSLKKSFLSRNLSLISLGVKNFNTLRKARQGGTLQELMPNNEKLKDILHELNLMKGSIQKFGQMLTLMLGDQLPPEIKKLFSGIESNSYFLDWEKIAPQLSQKLINEINIETTPFAAASIGQVHRGVVKKSGEIVAIKIQYPGVKEAIDNDIKGLRFLLSLINIIPQKLETDLIFDEVKIMLKQEMDYIKEFELTEQYRKLLGEDKRFVMPKLYEEYCDDKCLVSEYFEEQTIRHFRECDLTDEEVNGIGEDLLELYLKEIFRWGVVQTDAHLGNFLIKDNGQVVLIDFGATKEVEMKYLKTYRKMIKFCIEGKREEFLDCLEDFGFEKMEDSDFFWNYTQMFNDPLSGGNYKWGESNVSDSVFKMIPDIMKNFPKGKPVGETLYIDRKIGQLYFVLKYLNAEFDPTPLVQKYILES